MRRKTRPRSGLQPQPPNRRSWSSATAFPRNPACRAIQAGFHCCVRSFRKSTDYSVANSSISGDITSGGFARLPAALNRLKPNIVIVELGANDALRGVPLATT